MNTYKHSGTLGDIIYALPIMKHFGGGEFYLHLNQIDWVGQHYYGSPPNPFHKGKMTTNDLEFMRTFLEAQTYITKVAPLDPKLDIITHNLDRFRPSFVRHPGNYVDIYASSFNIMGDDIQSTLRNTPWLSVPATDIQSKPIVINRTARWTPKILSPKWKTWQDMGWEENAIFVGLPEEHEAFARATGWDIPFRPTDTLLELAQVIANSKQFIGNQSVALSLAIGLGVNWTCEARDDLPLERNECYFPHHPNGEYF